MKRHFYLTLLLMAALRCAQAQDVESVIKADPIGASGGITFSQITTNTMGKEQSKDPYNYFLSGNINPTLFGVVSMPISFSYTNSGIATQMPQPFNRLSFSPSYKWVTLHGGYSSMNFSPYTLSGHEFFGGGMELTPDGPFKVSLLYGRFQKSVHPDTTGVMPNYKRMGGGMKVDYTHDKFDVAVNVFKAKDDVQSLDINLLDSSNYVAPQDNITGGVDFKFKVIKNLSLDVSYAFSLLNKDIRASDSIANTAKDVLVEQSGDLALYSAFKTSLTQTVSFGSLGVSYERVTPNYQTLGGYFFTNDFENVTADVSTTVFKIVNMSMSAGYQRDDLENQKMNSNNRMIFSGNASAQLSKKLSAGASYSNLQSYTHIRSAYEDVTQTNQYQNLDTLSFTQLNQSASLNLGYVLKANKSQRQNVNLIFSLQSAAQEQTNSDEFSGNQIYNGGASYMFSLIPQRLNISTNVNYNHNELPTGSMDMTSVNLSVRKAFYDNILKTGVICTYSHSAAPAGITADIINLRVTGGYTLNKKHNFNLSVAMVNNSNMQGNYSEVSSNLTYSYNFGMKLKRDAKSLKFEGDF